MLAAGSRDGDVSRADEARALVGRAVDELGGLDVVINGASAGFEAKPFEQVSEADVDAALGATVKGSFFVTQAATPHLRESRGLVVMIEDVAAYQPWPAFAAHCAAKAAQAMLTRTLAKALAPDVRVCGIAPGPVALEPVTIGSGVPPRPRCGGSARRTTSREQSSISRARTSSPARRSLSTKAGCCKPGRPAMRRPNAWMRQ